MARAVPRPFRRHGALDRGAAAVEFALVVPLLFLLVFGIIDFSRAYNTRISLSEAAAEGARTLALGGSPDSARQSITFALKGSTVTSPLQYPTLKACPEPSATTTTTVQIARVQISTTVRFLTPLASFLGPGVTVSGVGVRQCSS